MADTKSDPYVFARNAPESNRLGDQHLLYIKNVGYVIHPSILAHLPPDARVADVATGTGVWALHAAEILPPGARVVAFDISTAQFPAATPPDGRVAFVVADAKQPFPAADQGTFDLVHVRALIGALQPDDWDVVVRNVAQLLKPGGALMWVEGDLSRMRCLRGGDMTAGSRRFTGLPRLLDAFEATMGERLADGVRCLPLAVRKYLDDVHVDVVSSDRLPALRTPMSRMYMTALFGFAEKARVWSAEEVEVLKTDVALDLDDGGQTQDHASGCHRPLERIVLT